MYDDLVAEFARKKEQGLVRSHIPPPVFVCLGIICHVEIAGVRQGPFGSSLSSCMVDVAQSNQAKDMKLVTLQNEVNNLRNFLRVKDR